MTEIHDLIVLAQVKQAGMNSQFPTEDRVHQIKIYIELNHLKEKLG
jgi:hypothetical protein